MTMACLIEWKANGEFKTGDHIIFSDFWQRRQAHDEAKLNMCQYNSVETTPVIILNTSNADPHKSMQNSYIFIHTYGFILISTNG